MAQVNSGIRTVLSHPRAYEFFQTLMGSSKGWRWFVDEFVKAKTGDRILDIGCGTARILNYLPDVKYFGFDISRPYIEAAKAAFGARGVFSCRHIEKPDLADLPRFEIVIASGLLHHLDDGQALALLDVAMAALEPGGRLVSCDPAFVAGQNPLARCLIRLDRGRNVRTPEGYLRLAQRSFHDVIVTIRHRSWIPYTHCIMECSNGDAV